LEFSDFFFSVLEEENIFAMNFQKKKFDSNLLNLINFFDFHFLFEKLIKLLFHSIIEIYEYQY